MRCVTLPHPFPSRLATSPSPSPQWPHPTERLALKLCIDVICFTATTNNTNSIIVHCNHHYPHHHLSTPPVPRAPLPPLPQPPAPRHATLQYTSENSSHLSLRNIALHCTSLSERQHRYTSLHYTSLTREGITDTLSSTSLH